MNPVLWFIAIFGSVTVAYIVAQVATILLVVMAERSAQERENE